MKKISIVGAGASGLSILLNIKEFVKESLDISLIDPHPNATSDRNWCQWVHPKHRKNYHTHVWQKVRVRTPRKTYDLSLRKWLYARTCGSAYKEYVDAQQAPQHRIQRVEESVRGIAPSLGGESLLVQTDQETITSDIVFTSWSDTPVQPALWQHFGGWIVRTNHACFDPDTATLMDFDIPQPSEGVAFMYVLPYTATHALVECTLFSRNPWEMAEYEVQLKQYMLERFSCSADSYVVESMETGKIPMHVSRTPAGRIPNLYVIGSPAGAVKPSTGYAFSRIQESTAYLVQSWIQAGKPEMPPSRSARFRWYDQLLIDLILHDSRHVISVFDALFRKTPIDLIFTFLDEKTSILQDIRIFLRLPKIPFLKAVWRTLT
jgi:lycopene beta-cyclase